MKIAYIVPGVGLEPSELERRQSLLRSLAFSDSQVDLVTVSGGPYTIESGIEEEYAAVSYLGKLFEIEDHYDAFIIGCFGDPGLRAARELISKPVVGPGEASYMVASALARKFLVLTPLASTVPITWSQLDVYGYANRVYDVVSLDIKVADIQLRHSDLMYRIVDAVVKSIGYGKAEALVLGCMSMGFAMIDEELSTKVRVPIINPVKVSLKFAELLAYLNLTHSKLTYPTPDLSKLKNLLLHS
ncbi:MAG: aspartate/glutamate racemase family protein [Sulfolobales archaeon]|nr:aspartate/glutamate racemase family protein [Sulfolobales archaeon]MDW7969897.1 aspartate/glutamate racemase family protein [Sulfolobales archaeon]